MHVIVIGSGVVGCSVAYEIAKAGAKVTVLEAGRLGGVASASSFAWTNATGKNPRPYFEINFAGMRAHLELRRDFGSAPWFVQTGSLEWRTTEAGRADQLANFERMRAWGYGVEWLDRRRLSEMEPDIDLAAIGDSPITYYPEEGWIDPVVYAAWLLRAAQSRWNAVVRSETRVTAVDTQNGRVVGVRTALGERIVADAVVNCSGGWANQALGDIPAIPMASTVGVLGFTPPVALTLRSQFHADDMDVRLDGAGRVMVHKISVDHLLSSPEALRVDGPEAQALLAAVRAVLPALGTIGIEAMRTTMRPVPEDGFTCAGELPQVAGYYVAVTHSGVTLAPYLGKALAAEVVHGALEDDLRTFRPARFFTGENAKSADERISDPAINV